VMSRLVMMLSLLLSFPLSADIRVLFFFDESGHRLRNTYPIESRLSVGSRQSNRISPISGGRSVQNASRQKNAENKGGKLAGYAHLTWMDSNGVTLATTRVPDPRIAHSPGHVQAQSASLVARSEGAWLAIGPDNADSVSVVLPETLSINLGQEQWLVRLTN